VASEAYPGEPEIPCFKPAPLKNGPRPILSQLNNGTVSMKLDQPATSDGSIADRGCRDERTMPALVSTRLCLFIRFGCDSAACQDSPQNGEPANELKRILLAQGPPTS
jgi:hypothetical protein